MKFSNFIYILLDGTSIYDSFTKSFYDKIGKNEIRKECDKCRYS